MSSRPLSATSLAPSALPRVLPIFPLAGATLLPRVKLPLNIFEPRYLAMVEDVLGSPGRMIGMIQPQEPDDKNSAMPPIYRVGCAGRIMSFHEMDDGRFLINLVGVCRFTVAEELPFEGPYRRVRPDWAPFAKDMDEALPGDPAFDRKYLLGLLHNYFKCQGIDSDWEIIHKTPDELLISSLVMICPMAPNEKQALLEAPDLATRAAMMIALLEMALMPQPDEDGVPH